MKWSGIIGYAKPTEIRPGVWKDEIVEKKHYGDVIRNARALQSADKVNDNINITNQISIVANPYANMNFHTMRYIEFMGSKWKITNIEVNYPRLILSLGGVYNG